MATRIKLTSLERRIFDRLCHRPDYCEPVEEMLAVIGVERNWFVNALEALDYYGLIRVGQIEDTDIIMVGVVGTDEPDTIPLADFFPNRKGQV